MLKLQNIAKFATKSKMGGSSKTPEYDLYRTYKNDAIMFQPPIEGTTIVRSHEDADKALKVLLSLKGRATAWDTETIDLDVKSETPINRGRMICCSAYAGPDVDFGNGPRLFIDNFCHNSDLVLRFREYFEDEQRKKIWHNYGFDRHIFNNCGIDIKGFQADTMHMARLLDPSRLPQDYSLARMSQIYEQNIKEKKKIIQDQGGKSSSDDLKISMTNIFAVEKKLKSGETSKIITYPSLIELHMSEKHLPNWIKYSCLDAEITWYIYWILSELLTQKKIQVIKPQNQSNDELIMDHHYKSNQKEQDTNMFGIQNLGQIYQYYWRPFGELLTEMERTGMLVDLEHVQKIQLQAQQDVKDLESKFKSWVQSTQKDDVSQFNVSSASQLQQLFFAPCKRDPKNKIVENDSEEDDGYYSDGRKKPIRKDVLELELEKQFKIENTTQIVKEGRNTALKYTEMTIRGLGIQPSKYTPSGLPSTDNSALVILAGDVENQKYGTIYNHFQAIGQPEKGIEACKAIDNLLEIRTLEVLLNTFINPLLELTDKDGRVHTSLNINTETGRLSSKNPNLLNQPALEKDRYKIRKSFIAPKGMKYIVADYGQLELRVLAHLTKCRTMIDAFLQGGDFHSRTAITMYPEIAKEIQDGKLLLEWDKSKGVPPVPLVKDKYASERKKAKTMNFSIAYGKTSMGFAQDWGCTQQEAQQTIDKWFDQRKEVKEWQELVKKTAEQQHFTQTLLGRFRNMEKYFINDPKNPKARSLRNHGLRAAINTPVQGGAADIVIAAMIKIRISKRLKNLGYKLILQVHDELILEGPEENAEEALKVVKEKMEHPFRQELELPLEVDAKIGNNWYECK